MHIVKLIPAIRSKFFVNSSTLFRQAQYNLLRMTKKLSATIRAIFRGLFIYLAEIKAKPNKNIVLAKAQPPKRRGSDFKKMQILNVKIYGYQRLSLW